MPQHAQNQGIPNFIRGLFGGTSPAPRDDAVLYGPGAYSDTETGETFGGFTPDVAPAPPPAAAPTPAPAPPAVTPPPAPEEGDVAGIMGANGLEGTADEEVLTNGLLEAGAGNQLGPAKGNQAMAWIIAGAAALYLFKKK